ncbi:hypothetical protein TNCV_4736431 [Trichonephila clavipes]|nr:hypothetical protein TNCV_4736431 [Trichonephila clavipes]
MPSIGGYHPYGLPSILIGLEEPSEHMLGQRIATCQPPLNAFQRALLDEWCDILQDQIDNLTLSMPRRYIFNQLSTVRLLQRPSNPPLQHLHIKV